MRTHSKQTGRLPAREDALERTRPIGRCRSWPREAPAEALQRIPTEGEISIVAQGQGGFIARALPHPHDDELCSAGETISRDVTLAHPYSGRVVDPAKVAAGMCFDRDDLDRKMKEWLWGWKSWLGTAPVDIDDADFPQIEWSAVVGEGIVGGGGTAPLWVAPTGAAYGRAVFGRAMG